MIPLALLKPETFGPGFVEAFAAGLDSEPDPQETKGSRFELSSEPDRQEVECSRFEAWPGPGPCPLVWCATSSRTKPKLALAKRAPSLGRLAHVIRREVRRPRSRAVRRARRNPASASAAGGDPEPADAPVLRVRDVAKLLAVSERHVERLAASGALVASDVRASGIRPSLRWRRSDVEAFLASRRPGGAR